MARNGHAADKGEVAANVPFVFQHYSRDELLDVLYKMYVIRRFEEGAENSYMRGLIHGTMHLSIGQEAVATGAIMTLQENDQIMSNHRGHGHCVAFGADVNRMFAEFFGKVTGYCKGRGGSMHIADFKSGNLGANGIVGGGIPIAVGAAFAVKSKKEEKVVLCFFGDGANNEGAFHEAVNMAALWKLPIVFLCENNGYGLSVSVARASSVPNISDRAKGYGIPGVTVDGNCVSDVAEAVSEAVERARSGEGPSIVECKTYRHRGHSKSDRNRYRTKEEIDDWIKNRDPIDRFEMELKQHGFGSDEVFEELRQRASATIDGAIEFAKNSESPSIADVSQYVYTEQAQ
ncbi:thiamine pyrophosphate-dependent dehydrogenase E1 component subunit alpha [Rhodobacteraceae bacterium RKSG542]|uniref:thiamine pyrophosphate-dependent dehydrogenase E1 component subunit alpha n=1 Tax=Pseudovibrio flavus TaxID=2529854 RepID=UPI0012BD781A|nr:thiamine pyrophosphate-dependent dehydrogenase E1 component subunit alpha [Pseudovibrio flavus]MTI16006.1 thiamine pyrophosphate-dependent dehydrogenase E1 component subunit alpha [Pseudovibrio flavus]